MDTSRIAARVLGGQTRLHRCKPVHNAVLRRNCTGYLSIRIQRWVKARRRHAQLVEDVFPEEGLDVVSAKTADDEAEDSERLVLIVEVTKQISGKSDGRKVFAHVGQLQ